MQHTADRLRVPPEQLRWQLDPKDLGFGSTDDVVGSSFTPGQYRAVRALEIGLDLRGKGFNVFVAGEPGTSRSETLRQLLDAYQDPDYVAEDLVFVNNFRDEDRPRLLRFPAGRGCAFRDSMSRSVDRLQEGIPRIFKSDIYSKRRKARVTRYSGEMEALAAVLKEVADPLGLVLVQVEMGDQTEAELFPLIDGEPIAFEDLEGLVEQDKLPKEKLAELVEARRAAEDALKTFREAANKLVKKAEEDFAGLDRQVTRPYLNVVLSGVHREYQDIPGMVEYLKEVEDFLESRLSLFRTEEERDRDEHEEEEIREALRQLQVNMILDNSSVTNRPVIYENNPGVTTLRGTVDREIRSNGSVVSDFTHIKAGALIRGHGGFVVIHADDLEGDDRVWGVIKRALRTGQVQIEILSEMPVPRVIRPEPVAVDVKVILIGSTGLYHALLENDPDFRKLFKFKAEFDTEMELGPQSITEYACWVRNVCDEADLPSFSAEGVAAVVEYGVRLAGQRNRISTRITQVADLVREAAFWAQRHSGNKPIEARDVQMALEERRHRVNLDEERVQRMIREGVILIETEGAALGQVNGISVLDVGDHRFGRPARITASVSAGNRGVINIERMAELSGSYHDKGLLIISGYLRERFAIDRPVTMTASITLEQSYSEVDGDSASVAEMLALFSALSGLPARQDLAMTGSVNQKGEVQVVGGVNEKVEGFFDLCASRGLTGSQGVILPVGNLPHLMLRPRVVDAVRDGRFHVYSMRRVEEAVELLLGHPAGERDAAGEFAPDTVFGRVDARIGQLAEVARRYFGPVGSGDGHHDM